MASGRKKTDVIYQRINIQYQPFCNMQENFEKIIGIILGENNKDANVILGDWQPKNTQYFIGTFWFSNFLLIS